MCAAGLTYPNPATNVEWISRIKHMNPHFIVFSCASLMNHFIDIFQLDMRSVITQLP